MRMGLTGKTGFLGTAIYQHLQSLAEIVAIGRNDSDIVYDFKSIYHGLPQVDVFVHCAGLAHIGSPTEQQQKAFFEVNVNYTLNLLKSIEKNNVLPKTFVLISSVSVYGTTEGIGITEETPLAATDAYGRSKIQAEETVIAWCKQNNVKYTILRLPLIVGKDAPGNFGAMVNGIKNGYYFNIDNGIARRSMILQSDIPLAIEKSIGVEGVFNLSDGYHPSFNEISNLIATKLGKRNVRNMPLNVAKVIAKFGDLIGERFPLNTNKLSKLTKDLTFNDTKARLAFNWNPTPVLKGLEL